MEQNSSVVQLTTDTLAIVSPEEVILVAVYDPNRAHNGDTARGPQGFGASEAIVLILPFIYSFFTKYVEALGTEAGKKCFGAINEWLLQKDDKLLSAAREEIERSLIDSGIPTESVGKSTDAIIKTLRKG